MSTEIKRALLSVTDKMGIVELARQLAALGIEIVSTGGTAKALAEGGVTCTLVETITGFPEMMGGRLKTLHPNIFGGILANREIPADLDAASQHGIGLLDLVVVNLYKFSQKPGIENIDVGGPSMLRAAAKNAASVTVVVDPVDYDVVIQQIRANGAVDEMTREALAIKVFGHTAEYDHSIHQWMLQQQKVRCAFLKSVPTTH